MNNRKYLIIPASEIKKIVFDDILETAADTLVYSGDGKRTFIKWTGEDPEFISTIKNATGPYSQQEILEIIRSDEWTSKKKTKSNVA